MPGAPARSASTLVFSLTVRGTFVATGNTLGLASEASANGPGTVGSTHTFVTLNAVQDLVPSNPSNPWPLGTTNDWTLDGSAAVLTLPTGSVVRRAELLWGGSYKYVEDVSGALDGVVQFTTPNGSVSVAPNPTTARTLSFVDSLGSTISYYVRSANVTPEVAVGGSGMYAVAAVPGTQNETINALNALGWALVVVVQEDSLPCRTVDLVSPGSWIDEDLSRTVVFGNVATPLTGDVAGRVVVAALEGDVDGSGDAVEIGDPIAVGFLPLSGPNNPEANFFASQINTTEGILDMAGTFGTWNHDALTGTPTSGGRQGFDLTGVAIGSADGTLTTAQSSISIRFSSTGDSYLATLVGLEVDTEASSCLGAADLVFRDGFESADTFSWSSATG